MRPLGLVTGATAGIGKVFAERLAARGHDLILVARDAARLELVAAQLRTRHGTEVEAVPTDLSRDDEIERLAARIGSGPPLAILVNNAGFGTKGTLARTDPRSQTAMLHLHTLAPMRLSQAALPGMLARGSGAIVNVSSVASFIYTPGNTNYSATKAYLTVFSEGLAGEVASAGVQVQALCPGFTRTRFQERAGVDPETVPGFAWMTAEAVVDASLASLARGELVCVPGAGYKILRAASGAVPRSAFRRFIGVVQGSRYRR